jgi:hypothetical protein
MIDGAARQRRQAGELTRQIDIANDSAGLAQRRRGIFDRTLGFRLRGIP